MPAIWVSFLLNNHLKGHKTLMSIVLCIVAVTATSTYICKIA